MTSFVIRIKATDTYDLLSAIVPDAGFQNGLDIFCFFFFFDVSGEGTELVGINKKTSFLIGSVPKHVEKNDAQDVLETSALCISVKSYTWDT